MRKLSPSLEARKQEILNKARSHLVKLITLDVIDPDQMERKLPYLHQACDQVSFEDDILPEIKKVRQPLSNFQESVDFDKSECASVKMGYFALTKANSDKPVLATWGAGPCFILALYDRRKKIAALAHVHACIQAHSLEELFMYFSIEDTEAHLLGGKHSTQEQCLEIYHLLKDKKIRIVNSDVIQEQYFYAYLTASLAIDARNGNIYNLVVLHIHFNVDCNEYLTTNETLLVSFLDLRKIIFLMGLLRVCATMILKKKI